MGAADTNIGESGLIVGSGRTKVEARMDAIINEIV